MKIPYLLSIIVLAMLGTSAYAAGSPETLAKQLCSSCHNVDGNSKSSLFPRLAGQKPAYIASQLREFRTRHRGDQDAHDYMWGIARDLDDKTIDAIADYFAAQTRTPNDAKSDPALIAAGSKLFKEGNSAKGVAACIACHGDQGEGSYIAPQLAGQHAAYVTRQLNVFLTDQRPTAEAMQAIAKGLSPDDVRAVAAFVQSLK